MGPARSRSAPPKRLGLLGESWARSFLEERGYKVVATNVRCRLGEIDLVAEEGGELVFVEVKTRKDTSFGYPEEQLSFSKRRRLMRLAQWYLVYRKMGERPLRFDVVSVLMTQRGRIIGFDLIQNAFSF